MAAKVPLVRLRPVPAYDPPYDDEQHPDLWGGPVQPTLDLSPSRRPRDRARDRDRDRARERPARPAAVAAPPLGNASPPARAASVWFVNTCLEILNGLRPATHLRRVSGPLAAGSIVTAMTQATRRLRRATRTPAGAAVRTVGPDRPGQRITLRRMRICEPWPGVVEIAAVIGAGHQCWAAAFRLEQRGDRWLCAAAAVL